MSDTEQNKTEDATPYKLKRGREKGAVAKSADLGFFAALAGFCLFALTAGSHALSQWAERERQLLSAIATPDAYGALAPPALSMLSPLLLLMATVVVAVVFFEIVQVRGIVFSAHPLKPDFSRLNPAKGLKRLLSLRMLKETLKNIAKLAVYAGAAYAVITDRFAVYARSIGDSQDLVAALSSAGLRLVLVFTLLALAFAALDQVLARGEFRKQMRMSRREVEREHKEREGEPRLKQKRRQLHAQFAKQARALGNLAGSDMVIVNPQHYAVALRYDAATMGAPKVVAKGRNHFALYLKREAARHAIAVFENPPLARALFANTEIDCEIVAADYRAVADLYIALKKKSSAPC